MFDIKITIQITGKCKENEKKKEEAYKRFNVKSVNGILHDLM